MSLTEGYGKKFMKQGGIHGVSQASTFIEKVFEEKCMTKISEGDALLNEWRIRKGKYMDLGRGTAFDFLHYSRHDASHSVNILNSVEMVLGKQRVRKLSTSDLWLLLECAYYHDLAMSVSYSELRNLWKKDKDFKKFCQTAVNDAKPELREAASCYKEINTKLQNGVCKTLGNSSTTKHFMSDWPLELQKNIMVLTGEYLRRKHASDAKKGLPRVLQDVQEVTPGKTGTVRNSVIKKRLNQLVESVSALHGENFNCIAKELPQKTRAFSTENVHPQFIAAMLRLGDLLDLDNNRFDPISLRRFGSLPHESWLHYEKHEAITQFVIDTHAIEAKAYSDDYEVCQTVSDWFENLEEEVNKLICAWNNFAPGKLRGCTLTRCDLKVYYKGLLFDITKQKRFEVDKDKMIDLVIGSNVYDSKIDCIREYVQNAMDASKMKLWMDVKNGALGTRGISGITPFDVNRELYEKLQIEVRLSVNIRTQSLRIAIIDHGIGMEQECIDSLSIIGSGWKGRKLYRDETQKMPKWLRPTGGFGIGLQSVFMLADKVEIRTRSAREHIGHTIILYAPKEKKPVAQHDNEKYNEGTEMKFEIKLDQFYSLITQEPSINLNEHKEYNLDFPSNMSNAFDRKSVEVYIMWYMEYYLNTTFPDTLIPIKLTCDGRDPILIRSRYASHEGGFSNRVDSWDDAPAMKRWDKKLSYSVSKDFTVRIWDKERDTFACVVIWSDLICLFAENGGTTRELSLPERKILNAVCYKNARVGHPDDSDDYLNWFNFLAVCIDFMGWNTSDVLPIQRSSFTEGFDVASYYRKYVALAIKIIHKEYQAGMLVGSLPMFYYLLAAIQLLEGDEAALIMDSFHGMVKPPEQVQIRQVVDGFEVEKTKMATEEALKDIARIFRGETNPVTGTKNVFVVAQEPIQDREAEQFSLNILDRASTSYPLPSQLEGVQKLAEEFAKAGKAYDNRYICGALLRLGGGLEKRYFQITDKVDPDGTLPTYVMLVDLAGGNLEYMPQNKVEDKEFLARCLCGDDVRYISINESADNPEYEKLKVDMLPGRKKDETKLRKNMYLISPVSSTTYRKILELAEVDSRNVHIPNEKIKMNKSVSRNKFIKTAKKDPWYSGIISWVQKHQIGEKDRTKLNENEIDELYQELLSDIYESCMSTEGSNV